MFLKNQFTVLSDFHHSLNICTCISGAAAVLTWAGTGYRPWRHCLLLPSPWHLLSSFGQVQQSFSLKSHVMTLTWIDPVIWVLSFFSPCVNHSPRHSAPNSKCSLPFKQLPHELWLIRWREESGSTRGQEGFHCGSLVNSSYFCKRRKGVIWRIQSVSLWNLQRDIWIKQWIPLPNLPAIPV